MNNEWTAIALINRARGNKGEVAAVSLSSHPDRFADLHSVALFGDGDEIETREIERVWFHDGNPVFKFKGVDSISDAEKLRGREIRVPRSERVELEAGEYFHSDLIGCEVRDRVTDRPMGRVTGWQEYGGPSLLEIDGGRFFIPFVSALCTEILPGERLIRVDLPEGLEQLGAE